MLGHRDKNLLVFGSWQGQKFADNPKFLFLYCLKKGMNVYWITKNVDVYNEMCRRSLPVEMYDSEAGISLCKKAGVAVFNIDTNDINSDYLGGATLLNLWHGVPLKKIRYDDDITFSNGFSLKDRIRFLANKIPSKKLYVFSTSPAITKIYRSAFRMDIDKKSQIIEIGQPRNDCFFDRSLKKRKYANIEYNLLISYLPTFRDNGKTKMQDDVLFDLDKLEAFCNDHNCLFVIKKHFWHRNEFTDLSKYPHVIDLTTDNNVDTQELMYNSDALITDYSSCYIDYLLLDRPIIFYCYDYEHYLTKDRGLYFPYNKVTPGSHAQNFSELIDGMQQALDGNLHYVSKQRKIKDFFYSKDNQGIVSPRLVEFIKTL